MAECDAKKVVETVQGGGEYAMDTDAEVKLTEEDLQIFTESKAGFISASDKGITVALNTELTEELIAEIRRRWFPGPDAEEGSGL
ncbi:MAG: DUF5915 domain-containing protein [Christensenellaceae bacterium]